MIFVTVGTHSQPFTRLVRKVDELKASGVISEPVFIQRGDTDYKPATCESEPIIGYDKMLTYFRESRIVICHAAPASVALAQIHGKVPIVVPRQREFHEQINDQQSAFTKLLEENGQIIAVWDTEALESAIGNYEELKRKLAANSAANGRKPSGSRRYIDRLSRISEALARDKRRRQGKGS